MADSEVKGPEPLASGIGRPLYPDWIDNFYDSVRRILPRSSDLSVRVLPGIVYVSGDELLWRGSDSLAEGDQDHRQELVANYAGSLVASLCERDMLDQDSTFSNISLYVSRPKDGNILDINPKRSHTKIGIHVVDIKREDGLNGYRVVSEKEAFLQELELPRKAHELPKRRVPLHKVSLGFINLTHPDSSILNDINYAIPQEVEFGPIGVVRTDTRPRVV